MDLDFNGIKIQLCKVLDLEYVKEIFDIKYRMKKYEYKAESKIYDKSCVTIRKHLIISLDEYHNEENISSKLTVLSFTINISFGQI